MGTQLTQTFRGKGTSRDKLTKDGQPKHAGNWSYSAIHNQSLQHQDYHVRRINGELIVGDHTPLNKIFSQAIADEATNNPYFAQYSEQGVKTVSGKQYEAQRSIRRCMAYGAHMWMDYEFIYHEQIYTDGDFDYNFPNY